MIEEFYSLAEIQYNNPIWLINEDQLNHILSLWELNNYFYNEPILEHFYGIAL